MSFTINVNTDANVIFVNRLERHSKAAFPVTIRTVLNKAAFNLKTKTMPAEAKDTFENRSPNFFKANSTVIKAGGFDLRTMKSTVGFTDQRLKGKNNYAVKDLQQQEEGGIIKKKAFIPMTTARGGKNKLVRPINRIQNFGNKIVRPSGTSGANYKQRFIKSVYHAGKGGLVLARYKNKMILWRVNSLNTTSKGNFKLTPLYSFKAGRSVKVKETGFMKTAAEIEHSKMDKYFLEEARKRLEK